MYRFYFNNSHDKYAINLAKPMVHIINSSQDALAAYKNH